MNIPEAGKPLITYDWYRGFLQFMILLAGTTNTNLVLAMLGIL